MTVSVQFRQRSHLETQIQDGYRRPFFLLGIQSAGKIGVRFTIDTDFFLITFSIRRETSSFSSFFFVQKSCGYNMSGFDPLMTVLFRALRFSNKLLEQGCVVS